jgi:hypothetical protein
MLRTEIRQSSAHGRFCGHLGPETASKPHLSNEVGGAIILASQRMKCFVTEFLKITECARGEQMIGYLLQGKTFSRVSSITKP